MELASIVIAVISAVFSIVTYVKTFLYEKRKATIECFNNLQNEVLDKFAGIEKQNAKVILENINDERCQEAYDGYRVLIARLEHFAVGVNKKIYDFKVVDKIAGEHLVRLYIKIKPIIDQANKNEPRVKHYCNLVELVEKLNRKYGIQI